MRKRQRGSITIFSVVAILVVTGFLLTLLEGARRLELQRSADMRSEMAVEAAFANYSTALWETYHLLGCKSADMEQVITKSAGSGYSEKEYGTNFLLLKLQSVNVKSYTLLTDADGAAYIHAVSSYMKNNILYEAAKLIYNQYESIKYLLESGKADDTAIENALESLEELENMGEAEATDENSVSQKTSVTQKSSATQKKSEEKNPLEDIQRVQKTQLLELVVPDTTKLSEAEYDMSEFVSKRKLSSGKNSHVAKTDWLDRVLLQQYLLTYFADYSNPKEGRGLSYELEYLIGGRDNDIENLRTVVNELLLIREAANFVYLLTDIEKTEQANLVALALAGVTANPTIIEVVKIGLLVAWAFAESVLDVRALLQGKKIPLIKSREVWTLALENVGKISEEYLVAKESALGISYKTYLGILLLFQKDNRLAYRAMDVQEITLQKTGGGVQMDELVVNMKASVTYQGAPVFVSLKKYQIVAEAAYGYY